MVGFYYFFDSTVSFLEIVVISIIHFCFYVIYTYTVVRPFRPVAGRTPLFVRCVSCRRAKLHRRCNACSTEKQGREVEHSCGACRHHTPCRTTYTPSAPRQVRLHLLPGHPLRRVAQEGWQPKLSLRFRGVCCPLGPSIVYRQYCPLHRQADAEGFRREVATPSAPCGR